MAFGNIKNITGVVTVNWNWCKGCGFCVGFCPTKALELSPDYNAKGYHPPVVKSPEDCRNCQFCQTICPEFAIYVRQEEDQKENDNA